MPRQSWGEVYERKGVGVSPGQDGRGSPFLLPRHPVFPPPISIGLAQYNPLEGGGGIRVGIVFWWVRRPYVFASLSSFPL